MGARRFDVLVVGSRPGGEHRRALVLARAGARVGLVDKAHFPRDKACGDLIGPRGLQVLADLGVPEPPGLDVGDMVVVGPTDRRVVLPCFDGATYPGRGRRHPVGVRRCAAHGRARCRRRTRRGPRRRPTLVRCRPRRLRGRRRRRAARRLRRRGRRCDQPCTRRSPRWWRSRAPCGGSPCAATSTSTSTCRPSHCGNQERWRAVPGYGWIFPGPDGGANLGIGIGTLADRRAGAAAVQRLPAFVEHLVEARAPRAGVGVAVAAPVGGLAQDGHGRDDARRRACAAGRRCGRIGQSPPG